VLFGVNDGIGALSSTFFKVDFVLTQEEVDIAIRIETKISLIFMINTFCFFFYNYHAKRGKSKIINL
jgi:hypothetical protein